MERSRAKSLMFLFMIFVCLGITSVPLSVLANDNVTLQVIGDDDRGMMLEETKISFKNGVTALSVLLDYYPKGKVVVWSDGYVETIDGLRAGKRGPISGWTYTVNEKYPEVYAGATKLKTGDKVVWEYVRN